MRNIKFFLASLQTVFYSTSFKKFLRPFKNFGKKTWDVAKILGDFFSELQNGAHRPSKSLAGNSVWGD